MRLTVADARRLPMPEGSVDLIVSNNTLEHIPLDVLHAIIAEFRRILSPTGLMSHFIDLSDHFAHFDRSITLYNFLQYSGRAWRIINNSIVPLNRLRIAEYRRLFAEEGFEVIHEERTLGSEEALAQVRLAPQFRQYPKEELLVTHCRMISVDARRHAQAAA
jgi:ubiquinone/menaquinone biosynthesis C-methylase UbiE